MEATVTDRSSLYEPPSPSAPWGKDILACIGFCVFLVMAIFYFQVAT